MEEALSEPISTDARPLFNATRVSDKIIYAHRNSSFVTSVGPMSGLGGHGRDGDEGAVLFSRDVCGQKEWKRDGYGARGAVARGAGLEGAKEKANDGEGKVPMTP